MSAEGKRARSVDITNELLRRLERAATAPLEVTKDSSSVEELHEATLAVEVDQLLALRDAIVRLDARLDAAGVPVAPDDNDEGSSGFPAQQS